MTARSLSVTVNGRKSCLHRMPKMPVHFNDSMQLAELGASGRVVTTVTGTSQIVKALSTFSLVQVLQFLLTKVVKGP